MVPIKIIWRRNDLDIRLKGFKDVKKRHITQKAVEYILVDHQNNRVYYQLDCGEDMYGHLEEYQLHYDEDRFYFIDNQETKIYTADFIKTNWEEDTA